VSRLILGAMGFGPRDDEDPAATLRRALAATDAAVEAGITVVDHADIYGGGRAESVFGAVLAERPGLRERLTLQTKCGITLPSDGRGGRYDLSPRAICERTLGSLDRLGVDHVDMLLLHRPDPLIDPRRVAEALVALHDSGRVLRVGVSNMSGAQIAHLQASLPFPIVADQLELSLAKRDFVESGVLVNHPDAAAVDFPHGTLEHCVAHGVELQAWGALAQGRYSGRPPQSEADAATSELVAALAADHDVSREAVVLAWLLRHPAGIRPVIGTTDPIRIRACAEAESVELSGDDWYRLWVAARGRPLP